MSNFFDTLIRHPESLKNTAGGVLSDLSGMGRTVMDALSKDNRAGLLGAGAVGGLLGALVGRGGRQARRDANGLNVGVRFPPAALSPLVA